MRKLSSRRASTLVSAFAGLTMVAAGIAPVSAAPAAPSVEGASLEATDTGGSPAVVSSTTHWEGAESETGLWIVRYAEPSVAAYSASLSQDSAQSVQSYREQLGEQLDNRARQISDRLGRSVDVPHTYDNVLNGLAIEVSSQEAAQVRSMAGVIDVYPDTLRELETDVSHEIILSDAIWSGETATDVGTKGEGIIVAMIDSGVNPGHPSFAVEDMDGYVHTNPHDGYLGVCAEGAADPMDICNDKLIGAYNFHPTAPNALDDDGHGSHVGSTIAGTKHVAQANIGGTIHERLVQGVAPHANVISYKVCHPSCPSTSSIAATNQAIADGVDVLNYSISGSDAPWSDPVDLAFLDAFAAGINVVASAGNDGPGPSTAAKSGPWNSAVAATTHHRAFGHEMVITGPGEVPELLQSMPGFPGDGPAITADIEGTLADAGVISPGNHRACEPLPADSMTGSIALIERGDCTFELKVNHAAAAGAIAVIIGNNVSGPPVAPGGLATTTIPAVQTTNDFYQGIVDFIAASGDSPVEGVIRPGTEIYFDEGWIDIVGGFSSRGPSQYDMLLPTFAAPGVNILAAGVPVGDDPAQYLVLQGTSMSSPHGAGAAALIRALNPDWTPSQVRSALATTGDRDLAKEDGITPADPFDIGGGRINLAQASTVGLVLDETEENFVSANPGAGGDPKTLNLPAVLDRDCAGVCSWERTVSSVVEGESTFTATVDSPAGTTVNVEPATFTLAQGEEQTVTITVTVEDAAEDTWLFGRIHFATDATHASGAAVADVDFPIAIQSQPATPELDLDPEELSSSQAPDEVRTQELSIGNTGGATLDWAFADATNSVVAEQAVEGNSGIVSDFFNVLDVGTYSADDFTLADQTEISRLHTPGFWNAGTVNNATALSWAIFADDGGVPAGDPESGGALWTFESAPGAVGVDTTDNNISLDLQAAGESLSLEAGTYWLSVWPSISTPVDDRWNWYAGVASGPSAQLIDPGNLFGAGATDWTALTGLVGWSGLAYTIEGPVACGADWLSVDPSAGSTAPQDAQAVEVSFDSAGLDVGTYTANLCLETNDEDNSSVIIPVTMTVDTNPAIDILPGELESTQLADTTTEHVVTITNTGQEELVWDIGEAEAGEGDLVGQTPANLPMGVDRATELPAASGSASAPARVNPTNHPLAADSLAENFDDLEALPGAGWAIVNTSEPTGTTSWFQGNPSVFSSHEGADDAYAGANFNNAGTVPGHISNWLLTPEVSLVNDSTLSFWTRTVDAPAFADRLEVRMSTAGASTDVGDGYSTVGDFTEQLLVINESLNPAGYPNEWTEFELTIEGLDAPTTGRLAFRYHVPNAGPVGSNSDYIGVDTVTYEAAAAIPHICELGTDIPWLSATPDAGTLAPGASADVAVTLDSAGFAEGDVAHANLCVNSNDPANPRVLVPVTMNVVAQDPVVVERLSGDNRYETAAAISGDFEPGVEMVFVATGENYPDALTGSALAGSLEVPVLLTRSDLVPMVTAAELERLAPAKVVVLGGPTAISPAVEQRIAEITGVSVERLAGDNRYETAVAVSQELGSSDLVYLATGVNYPDALAASAVAGSQDAPVLLVRPQGVPAATMAELQRLDPSQIVLLGGEGAVQDEVYLTLREAFGPDAVERIAGENRYHTAALLAEATYPTSETTYVASGMDWPDALTGAARAGAEHEPMMLTRTPAVPNVIWSQLLRLNPDRVIILGGPSAVSQAVAEALAGLR